MEADVTAATLEGAIIFVRKSHFVTISYRCGQWPQSTGSPQGQREVRTTAYSGLRHGTAKNANGSQLKADFPGYLRTPFPN
jgi:hypothetical protein